MWREHLAPSIWIGKDGNLSIYFNFDLKSKINCVRLYWLKKKKTTTKYLQCKLLFHLLIFLIPKSEVQHTHLGSWSPPKNSLRKTCHTASVPIHLSFLLFQWKRNLLKVKDNSSDSASILPFYIQIFDIQFKRHCYELNIFKEEYKTTIKQTNRGGTVTQTTIFTQWERSWQHHRLVLLMATILPRGQWNQASLRTQVLGFSSLPFLVPDM